ncbi:hypothetical protein GIB67_030793 [Kingdonia uniflora]|uniref:S-adenosyl-L-methionine-dependent methyltransferase n=1 Tax=Kingdonia uniflora TaxID=39325 RepID=A0A7J7L372_9MAGN|nr:hypothetical protein GIB67_030793 [Kingdonia uniflora]
MTSICISNQIRPLVSHPFQISRVFSPSNSPRNFNLSHKISPTPIKFLASKSKLKSEEPHFTNHKTKTTLTQEDGVPINHVKTLVNFKSKHNYIRVLEVSRKADHPFAGSRLLLLDKPGNIHSVSFLFKLLTNTYFDVFVTFPPILPQGPLGILGFGAGSAANLILRLYPEAEIYGWELDSDVISVGREYFGLSTLENENPDRLVVYAGDALEANVRDGFAGILVDLFSNGSLIPELQDPETWVRLKERLREGGRIMVNVGGSCVKAEDPLRDGNVVMEDTLKAMNVVFGHQVFVQSLGNRKADSSIALTGELPNLDMWKEALPSSLRCYVDMWTPFQG